MTLGGRQTLGRNDRMVLFGLDARVCRALAGGSSEQRRARGRSRFAPEQFTWQTRQGQFIQNDAQRCAWLGRA